MDPKRMKDNHMNNNRRSIFNCVVRRSVARRPFRVLALAAFLAMTGATNLALAQLDETWTVTVNGQPRQFEGPQTLPKLLKRLGVRVNFMAVAYNGEVLRKEQHPYITVGDGDALELVRPVGGGSRAFGVQW